MASRHFTDRDGAQWRVWSTIPRDSRSCLPGFEQGWLTFEHDSSGERRRLAPIPAGWEAMADDRMLLLCRLAQPLRGARIPTPVELLLADDGEAGSELPAAGA